MQRGTRLFPVLAPLFIAGYFLAFTNDARFSYFTPDDCMNLYRAWANPAAGLLKASVLFFLNALPAYRPIPGAWYRLIYGLSSFHPLPFHIVNLVLVAVDIGIAYAVARRLTDSRETGLLTALLFAYHGSLAPLYFDTAFIYDVICDCFFFCTLLYYLRIRSEGRQANGKQLLVLAGLYICALDSKEMALTLPFFIGAYELLYHRAARLRWRGFAVTALIAIACAAGRMMTGGLAVTSGYQPVFSWERFMTTSTGFVSDLLFLRQPLSPLAVLLIWLMLFLIAWGAKSAPLKFAWLIIMVSPIPVAFIEPRGPMQYYITFFGWVFYVATALVKASTRLFQSGRLRAYEPVRPMLLFLAAAACMARGNAHTSWADAHGVALEGERFRTIVAQVHRLIPQPKHGARILLMNDPLDDRWQMTSLLRLSYGDVDLGIDQVRFMAAPPDAAQIRSYDYVLSYRDCRFYPSEQPPAEGITPGIVFDEWCRPSVFHADGRAVTPQRPAKRGEVVMSMMRDLGETRPPVAAGQVFPGNPLAEVAAPVNIRVGGQPAQTWVKIGWPGLVNRYRVDFRIFKTVRPGIRDVEVNAQNRYGPPIPIAVR